MPLKTIALQAIETMTARERIALIETKVMVRDTFIKKRNDSQRIVDRLDREIADLEAQR